MTGQSTRNLYKCLLYGYIVLISVLAASSIVSENKWLSTKGMTPGIIIGSLFPFLALRYFSKHYLARHYLAGEHEEQNIFSWTGSALLLHLIVIFGFVITLCVPQKLHYKGSMFTGFYEYGKIYKSFEVKERDVLANPEKYTGGTGTETSAASQEKISDYSRFYSAYFTADPQVSDDNPTEEQQFATLAHRINYIPAMVALTFGFLGALVFCLMETLVRFNHADLYPKTFLFFTVRFVVSASIALILSFYLMEDWPIILSALIFFLIGYFPERAIKYLDEKMTKYLGMRTSAYEPIPLTSIQGLTNEKALRLRDNGVDDVQNLVTWDPDDLERETPFTGEMLRDWIGQSILIIHAPEKVAQLRAMGIRTIMDLNTLVSKESGASPDDRTSRLGNLADQLGMKPEHLENLEQILKSGYMKQKLARLDANYADTSD